jgi:hypothetical protein
VASQPTESAFQAILIGAGRATTAGSSSLLRAHLGQRLPGVGQRRARRHLDDAVDPPSRGLRPALSQARATDRVEAPPVTARMPSRSAVNSGSRGDPSTFHPKALGPPWLRPCSARCRAARVTLSPICSASFASIDA